MVSIDRSCDCRAGRRRRSGRRPGRHRLWAFETDGTERWSFNIPDEWWNSALALDDQRVYVPSVDMLHAIDRSGEQSWSHELSIDEDSPPTVAGKQVLIYGDGKLTALASEDGSTRWSVETDGNGAAVTTSDAIFMSGSGGRITALGSD